MLSRSGIAGRRLPHLSQKALRNYALPKPLLWTLSKSYTSGSTTPSQRLLARDEYQGPLTDTMRRLKMFSLTSLGLTTTLTPFIFLIEAESVPFMARCALAATAMVTSGTATGVFIFYIHCSSLISSALVSWGARSYVARMQKTGEGDSTTYEFETANIFLRKRITRVSKMR